MAPDDDPLAGALFRADVGVRRPAGARVRRLNRNGIDPPRIRECMTAWFRMGSTTASATLPHGRTGLPRPAGALDSCTSTWAGTSGWSRRVVDDRQIVLCSSRGARSAPGAQLPWEESFCRADDRGPAPRDGDGDGRRPGVRRARRRGWAATSRPTSASRWSPRTGSCSARSAACLPGQAARAPRATCPLVEMVGADAQHPAGRRLRLRSPPAQAPTPGSRLVGLARGRPPTPPRRR